MPVDLEMCGIWLGDERPFPDLYKLALITPKDWLEPGTGKLCRDCRYCSTPGAYKLLGRSCVAVLHAEKGHPGLVLYEAGNEQCKRYEKEVIIKVDLNAVERDMFTRLGHR